jgi:hypothetical protein
MHTQFAISFRLELLKLRNCVHSVHFVHEKFQETVLGKKAAKANFDDSKKISLKASVQLLVLEH